MASFAMQPAGLGQLPGKLPRKLAIAVLAAVCISLLTATAAWAFDIGEMIDDMLGSVLSPVLVTMADGTRSAIYTLMYNGDWDSVINGKKNWDNLLGTVWKSFLEPICTNYVSVAALQIMSLAFMMRLVSITKVAEGHDMQPIVTKVAITLIGFFIGIFVIQQAPNLFTLGWSLVQELAKAIAGSDSVSWSIAGGDKTSWGATITADDDTVRKYMSQLVAMGLGSMVGALFFALITLLATFICSIISLFMLWSKSLTLMIFAVFSPLAVAMYGLESTKSWALGFVKNVLAVMLSFVICLLILNLMPYLPQIIVSGNTFSQSSPAEMIMSILVDGAGSVMKFILLWIIMAFAMIRSGSIAKEILGG